MENRFQFIADPAYEESIYYNYLLNLNFNLVVCCYLHMASELVTRGR